MTMYLRSSLPSPFGRKIKIAADILGLTDQIVVEPADTLDESDSLRTQNPLGKIPVLITEDAMPLYDSRVILEYLDTIAGGGKIIPASQHERFRALREQALADGMMDAGILQVYEARMRPEEKQHQPWLDYQAEKVRRSLDYLEQNTPLLHHTPTVGEIALACALGYLDLRFSGDWRAFCPNLVEWMQAFENAVPAFEKTKPSA